MSKKILSCGRAGSGKTARVLDRIAGFVLERKEPECLFILPTQSQVDHVKSLLLRRGLRAFRDDFIHTFFTLTRMLAPDLPGQLLSEEGRDLLLADLLFEERLPSFGGVKDTPGFRTLLGRALKELKENGIHSRNYQSKVLRPLRGKNPRRRHRDLGAALTSYQARLIRQGRLDAEDLAQQAVRTLQSSSVLPRPWRFLAVDGFHDFTWLQFRILELLSARLPESLIALTLDPSLPSHPVFEVSASTRRKILDLGFDEEVVEGNHRTEDPTLLHLERGLYTESPAEEIAGEALQIVMASRREEEVENIARAILRLVREEGVAYREIGVLYRNLGEMVDLVEGTFARYSIPVRFYEPRSLEKEPVVRFLADLGRLLIDPWEAERLFRFLRMGYAIRASQEEIDRLDEAVRERGVPTSPAKWRSLCRRLALQELEPILALVDSAATRLKQEREVETLGRAWRSVFQEIALPLGEEGERGQVECAALESFFALLEEAQRRFRGEEKPATFSSLVERVEEGISRSKFQPQDRRREVVNVINAFEARQWEVSYLFVAGILERQFPPFPAEDLFFNDEERKQLAGAGLRFPDRTWRQQEERFLFYTALTRARKQLILSYPAGDATGNPTLPSFFLREVERLFTEGSWTERKRDRRSEAILISPEEVALPEEMERILFLGLEERYPRGRPTLRALQAAALYQQQSGDPAFHRRLASVLEKPSACLVDPRNLEEMRNADCRFSSSRLEDFLQCPYLHFAHRWLRLESLPERDLSPLDLGEILHEVARGYLEKKDRVDPYDLLEKLFADAASIKRMSFGQKTERWRMRRALEGWLRNEEELLASRNLSPSRFEWSFGEPSAPAPVSVTVDGREERLSGRIDRIDITPDGKAGLVVDYKYSRPGRVESQWKESGAKESLQCFQLAIYLLALKESLGLEPLGAELVALKGSVVRMGISKGGHPESKGLHRTNERRWKQFDPDEFEEFLNRAREKIARVVSDVRDGKIFTQPRKEERCGPGVCDAADLCRYEWWLGAPGEEGERE